MGAGEVLAGFEAALAGLDGGEWSDEELRELVVGLLSVVDRTHARVVSLVGEFDRRKAWVDTGCLTTKTWLQAFTRIPGPLARDLVRAADVVPTVPELAAAFDEGTVGLAQVREIVELHRDIAPEPFAEAAPVVVDAARVGDPHQVRVVCDRVRQWVAGGDPGPEPIRRGLRLGRIGNGWAIRGHLDAEGGAVVQAVLAAFTVPPVEGDGRDAAACRADALVEVARQVRRDGRCGPGGKRPDVALLFPYQVLDPAKFAGSAEQERARFGSWWSASAWLDWFGPVSPATARRVLCDSDVYRVVLDPASGLPLDVGRAYRLAPPWLRKALVTRDRGCRFPGCTAPAAWTDAHHVQGWAADHGPTALDNLILLCRGHHLLTHEGGWRLDFHPASGVLQAYRPDGGRHELGPTRPFSWVVPTTRCHPDVPP